MLAFRFSGFIAYRFEGLGFTAASRRGRPWDIEVSCRDVFWDYIGTVEKRSHYVTGSEV